MDVVTAGPPEWRWATAPATSSTIFMITPPCTAPRRLASNVVMIRDSLVCAAEDGRPGSSVSCTRYDGTGSGRKTCARHFRDRGELLVANGGLSQGDDLRHQAPRRVGRTTVQKTALGDHRDAQVRPSRHTWSWPRWYRADLPMGEL